MKRLVVYFSREKVILTVYVLLSIIIGLQHYFGGPGRFNNFRIFRSALPHLMAHQNLHLEYPAEYWDIFLYHPSFCIFFAPFTVLPELVAIVLWLIFCALALFFAIKALPVQDNQKVFFWWYILIELVTSMHSQQTNPIIAALGLFTFSFLEKGKMKWAALFPVLAFCIKGYGLIFAALFLFYPKKGEYILYSIIWVAILGLLPLPVTGVDHFVQVYKDWYHVLVQDHQVNYGFSVMGLMKIWFPSFGPDDVTKVQLVGLIFFAVTWIKTLIGKTYTDQNGRMLLLAYACIWVIIFNHAAESPTYVIAVAGLALYYLVYRDDFQPWARILIIFAFLFCILAPTDVYPLSWRKGFFEPYLIKVVPCVVIWFFLQIQLLVRHAKY
jgi:hypothetical protein